MSGNGLSKCNISYVNFKLLSPVCITLYLSINLIFDRDIRNLSIHRNIACSTKVNYSACYSSQCSFEACKHYYIYLHTFISIFWEIKPTWTNEFKEREVFSSVEQGIPPIFILLLKDWKNATAIKDYWKIPSGTAPSSTDPSSQNAIWEHYYHLKNTLQPWVIMLEKSIWKLIMFLNCLAVPHHLPGVTFRMTFRCSRHQYSLLIINKVQISTAKLPLFHIEISRVSRCLIKTLLMVRLCKRFLNFIQKCWILWILTHGTRRWVLKREFLKERKKIKKMKWKRH